MDKTDRVARTRLTEARRRRRWSQQELADRLGTTQNNVSRWELGLTAPGPYFRTRLCDLFGLQAHELQFLLEGKGEALVQQQDLAADVRPAAGAEADTACIWGVPYRRNPWFTGQEQVLAHLARRLPYAPEPLALCGMGGVGKTQVALEYAYRSAREYCAVFWIGAETLESILASLWRVAELLALPERGDRDQQRVAAAVLRWLDTHERWLLIWDNVEDLHLLDRFLPATGRGARLLTTRNPALGPVARCIELAPLAREEGLLLLLRRAKVLEAEATDEQVRQLALSRPGEHAAAVRLVEAMGSLPLALDQAGAYIEETQCAVAGYLDRYEQRRYPLLDRRGAFASEHPPSVAATLWLCCQQVAQQQPAALDLLRFCAFVAPDDIPEDLVRVGASSLGEALGPVAADPYQLDQALAALRSLSLAQRHSQTATLSLHRLVQVLVRGQMSESEQTTWRIRVVAALHASLPEVTAENPVQVWERCERLLPHLLTAVALTPEVEGGQALVEVLERAATYLRERTRFALAEPLYRRALVVSERLWGMEHADLTRLLTGLAHLYQEQSRFALAEPLYRRAIDLCARGRGQQHADLAHPLTGLATLYERQGRSDQAEPLFQQAIHIREQALGEEHPLVAQPLNGLAILYRRQGQRERARALYERALRIREQALGKEHPRIAHLLYNLAHLCQEQGQYQQAEALFARALQIEERAWGSDYPDLSYPLIGLADLYQKQGRDEQAEPLLRRALRLWEQALGPQHLLVCYPLHNLGMLFQGQGSYAQAEACYQRALGIVERVLGPEHLEVALLLTSLAGLYAARGEQERAETIYIRALRLREQALPPEHPDLATSLNGLANLFRAQGRNERAEPLYRRALAIREGQLGQQHPETAQTLHDLAVLCQAQGQLREALSLARRALAIRTHALGASHPGTCSSHALCNGLLARVTSEGSCP